MTTTKRALIVSVYSKHSTYAKPGRHINGLTRLLAVLTLVALLWPHITLAQEFRYMEPDELLRQIEAKADIVLLDAQAPKNYAEAHIKGAINVAGMAQIEDLDLPHSRPLVIYCDCAGEEASRFLATRLIKNGYKQENITILRGGWYTWLELGYPVEKRNQPQSSNESQGQEWRAGRIVRGGDVTKTKTIAITGSLELVGGPMYAPLLADLEKEYHSAAVKEYGEEARFYLVIHGGSGSLIEEIHAAVHYGVLKMNIDTETQYAFTRAITDHLFRNYSGAPKIDGDVGDKKVYDQRVYMTLAETAMAERVKQAVAQLRGVGMTMMK